MKKGKKWFYFLGEFLVRILKLDQPGKGKQELQNELMALSAGSRQAVRRYYVRKVLIVLAVLLGGLAASLVCLLTGGQETQLLEALMRPGYGESDRREEVSVQIEDGEVQELEVTVQARKYTEEEKEALLHAALVQLDELLPGQNASLDCVRSALAFPSSLENGAVTISWMTVPYGIIKEDGSILSAENEEGTLVEIRAALSCQEREAEYTAFAKVFPPVYEPDEQMLHDLKKEVEQADDEDSHTGKLVLPTSVDGKQVTWLKVSENPFMTVFAASLLLAAALYLRMDSQVHKKAEERRNQLLLDYPDLMWKLTMLLGAGMSIKGAFLRISQEYLREKNGKEEGRRNGRERPGRRKSRKCVCRYLYEEISYTCYEMQSGIGEAQAYERFGRRCQSPEYIRIGAVLSQNLRKGSKGLTQLLETEAEASLNDRKNHARKIGEQAGTKLLMPMALMLGVVLAILVIPAFLTC